MKRITIVGAVLLLTGCASGTFTTRASVTLAQDKVLLSSQWGILPKITTELDDRDAKEIIAALKAKPPVQRDQP